MSANQMANAVPFFGFNTSTPFNFIINFPGATISAGLRQMEVTSTAPGKGTETVATKLVFGAGIQLQGVADVMYKNSIAVIKK